MDHSIFFNQLTASEKSKNVKFVTATYCLTFYMASPLNSKTSSKSAVQVQAQATEAMAEPAYTVPVFRQR